MSIATILESFFQFCLHANIYQLIIFVAVLLLFYYTIKLILPVVKKKFEGDKDETATKALDTINKMISENTKCQSNSNFLLKEVVQNNSNTMLQVGTAIESLKEAIMDLKEHAALQDERTLNTQILVRDVQNAMVTKDALTEVRSSMVRKEEIEIINGRISAIQNNCATKADILPIKNDLVAMQNKIEKLVESVCDKKK